ncbi:MAG: ABC transporter substrate-binding protein [Pelovirga sp.]
MMMKSWWLFGLVLLLAVSVHAQPAPLASVERMVNSVIEILDHPDLSLQEKKRQVRGRVEGFLNIDSMSQRTLGNHWQSATVEQRERFVELFSRILEGTYLNRIDDYSGGSVKYLQQRVKDDRAIVDTVIIADELELPVQYKMVYQQGSWQVFDLVIEGVSLVMNYRSSYGEIIRREGLDGLFRRMEERITAMDAG